MLATSPGFGERLTTAVQGPPVAGGNIENIEFRTVVGIVSLLCAAALAFPA